MSKKLPHEPTKASFPGWPVFTDRQIAAANAVLQSGKVNYWTGDEGKEFEREYAALVGVRYAIAAANGTVTLEMALRALGIGRGDDVIVSPRSFIASASCAVMVGANPVFADVDEQSGNLTATTISAALTPRTKAVLVVHLAGWPCEMDEIKQLAEAHSLRVIEDCAQAHGARYRGRHVGSLGDVGSFSFCQDKIITTGGEGGMLTTDDPAFWDRLWSLRDHGKSFEACFCRQWPQGFRWLHEGFGSNYRMTEIQAAVGRAALRDLPEWLERRRSHARKLATTLRRFSCICVPEPPTHIEHAYYKFYCQVRPQQLRSGWSRDRIMNEITQAGAPCFSGTCSEIYLEKAFDSLSSRPIARLQVARQLGDTSLMFLVHPTFSDDDMSHICHTIDCVIQNACI